MLQRSRISVTPCLPQDDDDGATDADEFDVPGAVIGQKRLFSELEEYETQLVKFRCTADDVVSGVRDQLAECESSLTRITSAVQIVQAASDAFTIVQGVCESPNLDKVLHMCELQAQTATTKRLSAAEAVDQARSLRALEAQKAAEAVDQARSLRALEAQKAAEAVDQARSLRALEAQKVVEAMDMARSLMEIEVQKAAGAVDHARSLVLLEKQKATDAMEIEVQKAQSLSDIEVSKHLRMKQISLPSVLQPLAPEFVPGEPQPQSWPRNFNDCVRTLFNSLERGRYIGAVAYVRARKLPTYGQYTAPVSETVCAVLQEWAQSNPQIDRYFQPRQ